MHDLVIRTAPLVFTDDPLIAGTTVVKAVHITELQNAVNALRAAGGIAAYVFSANVVPGTIIRATDLAELRRALDEARAALGFAPLSYANPVFPAISVVRAVDINEIRNGVR